MSTESKGFSNALLIMLSEDTTCSTPKVNYSIECTPGATPETNPHGYASKYLSQELMKKLDDCSPVKPFKFEEEEVKKSLFCTERNYLRLPFSTNTSIPNDESNVKSRKQGWYCCFCNNFNYEGI
jgi:hypothetical protein